MSAISLSTGKVHYHLDKALRKVHVALVYIK